MPAPRNAHVAEPFMSILNGFAGAAARDAGTRMVEMTEREVHWHGDRPFGNGWVRLSTDPSGYSIWERTRAVRAANPTAEACADVRQWQRERAAR